MLSDIFELRADWGLRRESVEECAARLARMLDRLSDLHPGFRHLIVEPNWNAARPSGLLIPPDIRDLNHLVSSLQVAGALPPDFDLIDPAMSIPGFAELLRALGVVSAEFTPSFEEEFEPGPSFDEFCDLPFDYSNITITYEDQGDGMGIYCGRTAEPDPCS